MSDEKLAVLEERVTNWMESTTSYRKELCRKIDLITDKLSELPCRERKGWYSSMNAQIRVLWVFVSGLVAAVVIKFIQ